MTSRRRELIRNRLLLEQQRNVIFHLDNDIAELLENSHIQFLLHNNDEQLIIEYYYRRRELSYINCITQFEEIKNDISALQVGDDDKLLLEIETGDYQVYYDINRIFHFLNDEKLAMIDFNGDDVRTEIYEEINSFISYEILMLKRIKLVIDSRIIERGLTSPTINQKIQTFLKTVNERLAIFESIDKDKIKDLISSLDKKRRKIVKYSLKPLYLLQKIVELAFTAIIKITKTEVIQLITEAIQLSKTIIQQRNYTGIKKQKELFKTLKTRFLSKDYNTIDEYTKRFNNLKEEKIREKKELTHKSLTLSDNIRTQCVSIFSKFKDSEVLIEKCKKYNATLSNKKEIDKNFYLLKEEFEFEFDDTELRRTTATPNVINYINNSIASLFARYLLFNENMRFNDLDSYFVINKILIQETPDGAYKEIRQSGIDAGGVKRDFINALTTELFEKKIFISRDGSNKYFLNPEFEPDKEFKHVVDTIAQTIDFNFKSINTVIEFYTFIGLLLSFFLVNECGIKHTLSLGIMALFNTTKPLDKFDYIYCLIDDFPDLAYSLFSLLDEKDKIKDIYMTYNDTFSLYTPKRGKEPNKDVNDANIEDYIVKLATFMMTKTVLRKNIDITRQSGEPNELFDSRYENIETRSEIAYKSLANGISTSIKTKLESSKIPIKTITSYLTAGNMSNEIITELKENFIQSTEISTMKNLFISHVLTKPDGMSEVDYFDFMTKLLQFWSGSTFFKKNERYRIEINSALSPEHLPQSHTCYFIIDLPLYTSGTVLFEKLEMAISNVEVGIGLRGGAGKNKKRKPLRKYN